MALMNKHWVMISQPVALAKPSDFELRTLPVRDLRDDEVLVQLQYISLDPGLLTFMKMPRELQEGIPHEGAMGEGETVRAWGLGKVIASKSASIPVGAHVRDKFGFAGLQEYAVLEADGVVQIHPQKAPLPAYLNALGMPGLTAYFGMMELGKPAPGKTALVSTAAGAVGSIAGQLAQLHGCKVTGLAGGPDKCRYVIDELGFDDCIDYKSADVFNIVRSKFPLGVDIYFDNVGGELLEICLQNMAVHGRVVFCGAVAEYSGGAIWRPTSAYSEVLTRRLTWQGLGYWDYVERFPKALDDLQKWIDDGAIKSREEIQYGLERFPEVFSGLFSGSNKGKLILGLQPDA